MRKTISKIQNEQIKIYVRWSWLMMIALSLASIIPVFGIYYELNNPSTYPTITLLLHIIVLLGFVFMLFMRRYSKFNLLEKTVYYKFSVLGIGVKKIFPFSKIKLKIIITGNGHHSPRYPAGCIVFNNKKYIIGEFTTGDEEKFIKKISDATGILYEPTSFRDLYL